MPKNAMHQTGRAVPLMTILVILVLNHLYHYIWKYCPLVMAGVMLQIVFCRTV